MLRSIKRRVSKLEGQLGRKQDAPLMIVLPGGTKEEAMEKHFREHPDHRGCEPVLILLAGSRGTESGTSPEAWSETVPSPPRRRARYGGTIADNQIIY